MDTEKKAKIAIFVGFAVIVIAGCLFGLTSMLQNAEAEEIAEPAILVEQVSDTVVEDYEFPCLPWMEEGYPDLQTYWNDLTSKRSSFEGISAKMQEEFAGYFSEEDIAAMDNLEVKLTNCNSIQKIGEYEAELNNIVNAAKEAHDAEIAAQTAAYSTSSGSGGAYYSNGSGLTPQSGVNYFNGRKETYYNLNMSGVISNAQAMGINGNYWVRDDGVKMYGDYVIVASQDSKGTLIDTSVGQGIVLDYCPAGTVDIATTW